jgi:AraC family transcriptional regulator
MELPSENLAVEEPMAAEPVAAELGLADTNGILRQPWISPARTSAGLGWDRLYVSTQSELPYQAEFPAARTHLVILHLDGPVTVRRGHGRLTRSRTVPAGGLFLHPAGRDLTVELGGNLRTVHAYLDDDALREAASGAGGDAAGPVELAEELGSSDPLVEQLMLGLDQLVRTWEPAARTYGDHLQGLLAAHLVRWHRRRPWSSPQGTDPGLSRRELAGVRAMMDSRLAEPIPLADLAAAVALSVSQFSRKFKAATGEPPHKYLMRLRLEQACRMLRAGTPPIAEVAALCGFTHQEHLTRVMRARLGTTPAALRRSN